MARRRIWLGDPLLHLILVVVVLLCLGAWRKADVSRPETRDHPQRLAVSGPGDDRAPPG